MAESPLANVELHLVQSLSDAMEMKRWASERRETPLGIDSESEGLNPVKDRLRLIQLGDMRHGWAVPAIWAGAAIEIIDNYDGEFLAHHMCFDRRVVKHSTGYGIPWWKLNDSMFIAALADPTRPKGLKPLSARLIDRNATAGEKLLHDGMKANGWNWATVPADYPPYYLYAALDPVLACHVWNILAPNVLATAPEAYDLERSVTPILASMMDAGLFVDKEYVTTNLVKIRESIAKMREWLSANHNVTSLMSARQIHTALSAQGVEVTATTKTGLPSIDKETLELISINEESPSSARDLAKTILRARHGEKICGTYLENFLEIVGSDGAIHPSINQLPARTSRMCLAKGTLVDTPRDLLKYPVGVPIQDIRAGDDVYSFNDCGNVVVQHVKAVHDNGTLPVMRLVYRRRGAHGGGLLEMKATPDHRIALRTGEYRQLRDLKPGDKLGFMVRSVYTDGSGNYRSMLEWNGGARVHEPRVISNSPRQRVVHHENGKTLDQRTKNLEPLTRAEHMREHALGVLYSMSREELQQFADSDTSYARLAAQLGVMVRKNDVIRRCRELGITVRTHQESKQKLWYVPCPLSPEEFWQRMRELGGVGTNTGGGDSLAKELGVTYSLVRKWKREFADSKPAELKRNCPFTVDELAQFVNDAISPADFQSNTGYSAHRIKHWCSKFGVQWPEQREWTRRRLTQRCPLSASQFFAALERTGSIELLAASLDVSVPKCRRWEAAFSAENHDVIAVIDDGEVLPVYDLEMEGFPNFVANELWVHNSVSDPSLQNLPTTDVVVRGSFCPHPGNVLVSCDFSQVEMRIAASLSDDAGLIAAFHEADNGGRDFYSAIAGELFGGVIEKKDPRRQAVKSMSYASLYGAGLAKQAFTAKVTVAQLRPIREAFDARFPGLSDLARTVQEEAISNMAIDPEGRPAVRTSTGRWLPGDNAKAYALLNYKIQGEAAEQLKRAITSVAAAGLMDMARLPIHDEILFEVPAESAEDVKRTIINAMTDNDRYAVPITCEATVMPIRWSKG